MRNIVYKFFSHSDALALPGTVTFLILKVFNKYVWCKVLYDDCQQKIAAINLIPRGVPNLGAIKGETLFREPLCKLGWSSLQGNCKCTPLQQRGGGLYTFLPWFLWSTFIQMRNPNGPVLIYLNSKVLIAFYEAALIGYYICKWGQSAQFRLVGPDLRPWLHFSGLCFWLGLSLNYHR